MSASKRGRATHDRDVAPKLVWEILVEVGERVGVGRQRLVLLPQAVAGGDLAEAVEVDDVERADVVRAALQVLLPVAVAEGERGGVSGSSARRDTLGIDSDDRRERARMAIARRRGAGEGEGGRESERGGTHPVFQNRNPSISSRSSPIGA